MSIFRHSVTDISFNKNIFFSYKLKRQFQQTLHNQPKRIPLSEYGLVINNNEKEKGNK